MLGPLFRTDLRVTYHTELYALDASPFASGICSVQVGSAAVAELWRHCEQRGFYTRLEGPASALLRELGLDEDSGAGEVFGSRSVGPPAVLPRPLCEGLIWDVAVVFGACSAVADTVQLGSLCLSGNLAPPLGWPLTCLTTASSASSLLWPAENSSVTGFCTLRL